MAGKGNILHRIRFSYNSKYSSYLPNLSQIMFFYVYIFFTNTYLMIKSWSSRFNKSVRGRDDRTISEINIIMNWTVELYRRTIHNWTMHMVQKSPPWSSSWREDTPRWWLSCPRTIVSSCRQLPNPVPAHLLTSFRAGLLQVGQLTVKCQMLLKLVTNNIILSLSSQQVRNGN